jgi:uncharacterized integral membrane protein (TIGR00697 family)
MSLVVLALPVAPFMADYQKSLTDVFGNTWRIVMGSLIAFWCGSFANSYTLAKMKIYTEGKWLWTRIVGSTVVGEAVDSSLFYVIAFYVAFLKRAENEDYYDRDTDFTPFRLKV